MRYDAIKQELLRKKVEMEERLNETHEVIIHADGPVDQDFAEQVVQRQVEDVAYGLELSAKIELAQIKKAINSIEKEEYGVCKECGELIPYERLEAVPFTIYCMNCIDEMGS